jgi:hypothetical protein
MARFLHDDERFLSKLERNELELTKINVWSLLMQNSFDLVLEYTNEALHNKKLPKICPREFRRFLGTLFMSSGFNFSNTKTWEMMAQLTNNKSMILSRFNQILFNLSGFDSLGDDSSWVDQRCKLKQLNDLQGAAFKRTRSLMFDPHNVYCDVYYFYLLNLLCRVICGSVQTSCMYQHVSMRRVSSTRNCASIVVCRNCTMIYGANSLQTTIDCRGYLCVYHVTLFFNCPSSHRSALRSREFLTFIDAGIS